MSELPPVVAALRGCLVTRLIIDDALTLALCGAGRELMLRIDAPGELRRDGRVHAFDPDRDPSTLAPMIGLLNEPVEDVMLSDEGELALVLRTAQVTIPPGEHQLSWSLAGADGARASCLAEGKVVWE